MSEEDKTKKGGILADLLRNAVVPIVGFLVIAAAMRNSIASHLQQFWGFDGGAVWYNLWHWIYHTLFGGNEFLLYTVGTLIVTYVWFWTLCGFFLFVDLTQCPSFITRYKVQPSKNVPLLFDDKLKNAIKVVLRNQLILTPIFQVVTYNIAEWRGCASSPEALPDISRVIFDLACFVIFEEIAFYYTHILVHQPFLYKRVHKQHHEWTAPIGLVCIYAHPFEYLVSNIGPLAAGPLIMGSHLSTFWLWMVLAATTTIMDHSGYHLPFTKSPEFHDYHHLTFNNNFGVLGILDWLHGTDRNFRRSRAYPNHRILLSTTPVNAKFNEQATSVVEDTKATKSD